MRIRAAGLIEKEGKILLMHRTNVKPSSDLNKPYGEYYVFPGGGVEDDDETLQKATEREVLEEFGIKVKASDILYSRKIEDKLEEYVLKCEYLEGILGTGTGPEFSGDPKYVDRGNYIPEEVEKENIKNIRLLPEEFKEKLVKDIENNKI